MLNRRGFLNGLLATPIIIKTPGLLMPVKPKKFILSGYTWIITQGSDNFSITDQGTITARNIDKFGQFTVVAVNNKTGITNSKQFYINAG